MHANERRRWVDGPVLTVVLDRAAVALLETGARRAKGEIDEASKRQSRR